MLIFSLIGCGGGGDSGSIESSGSETVTAATICAGTSYPDPDTSEYVLPFPVGETYNVSQGNCGPFTHKEANNLHFAYDFEMAIGDTIVAARAGYVDIVKEDVEDGTIGGGLEADDKNWVRINHLDGTWASYLHIKKDGALVGVGDYVEQGQHIALSGDTGISEKSIPHLHFHVFAWDITAPDVFEILPISFRNASPREVSGLQHLKTYTSLSY
jgi:murein DD-endopeptidase MepM/ murein hydrolase activator NlpD